MLISRRSILRGLIAAPVVVRAGLIMPVSMIGIAPYGWQVSSKTKDWNQIYIEFNRSHPLDVGFPDHRPLSCPEDSARGFIVYRCEPAIKPLSFHWMEN